MAVTMEMRYTVELHAPLVMQDAKTLMVEGDNLANTLVLEVLDDEQPAILTGCTATAYMIRADGFRPFVACEIIGNIVKASLSESFYAAPGRYNLFVRLTGEDGETRHTLLWLTGWVHHEGAEGTIDPEDTLPTLDELLAQVAKIEDAVAKAEAVANMTAKAESLPAGSAPTASYKNGVLTLGIPQSSGGSGTGGVGIVDITVSEV